MKKRSITIALAAMIASMLSGCSFSVGTGNNAAPAKPANTVAANSSNSNTTSAKTESAKPKLADEKKPEGTAKSAKKNPVPDSWVYVYDEKKGYGFSLPEGSTGEMEKLEGIDVMVATTPAPSEIDVFVLAYKDETLSKQDLLTDAVKFLEGMGQKVTPDKLHAESDEYAVADATTVLSTGGKGKVRILVGTDVTDNYVMIIGTDESKFAANESIIDQIWGSFEMWSGGGS
ncbi:MAG: hypothetical protein ABL999_00560 [Pyrinomonadaceae bacterium]